MAKKKVTRKKSKKRGASKKARGKSKKTTSKKKTTNRRRGAENRRARQTPLSRGQDSGGAGVNRESESEQTFAAGQSGDNEGLSDIEDVDSESVDELAEEGQDYEAEIVEGVERAGDEEEQEVRTDVREEERPRQKRVTL